MIIKIAGLSEGVHNFSFDEAVRKVGLKEPFFGNFQLNARVTKSQHQVILDAEIFLDANFTCDRCDNSFDTHIETKYQMVYIFGKAPVDDDSLNITYLAPETDKINLTEEIRDYAVLAIPMKKLCREDCKGLCRNCGSDLNKGDCGCSEHEIDTRWLPLQELKSKLNNN